MDVNIHDHERMATVEGGLKSIVESLQRMELGTLEPVRVSLAELTKASIESAERGRGLATALLTRTAEVDRRIDDFSKQSVDNLAEHVVILRGMNALESALKETWQAAKDSNDATNKRLDIFQAQARVWFLVGTVLFSAVNLLKDHILKALGW